MATPNRVTVTGFLMNGPISLEFPSERKAKQGLKKLRKQLSDHYYFALAVRVINADGTIIREGNPKGAPKPKVVNSDVYVSAGGAGMTFLWKGQRGRYHYNQAKSGKENRAAFKELVVSKIGNTGWMQLMTTMQSFAAYERSQSYQ